MNTSASARRWIHVLLAVVAIGLLLLLARGVDWHRAWEAATNARPDILAIAVAANLSTVLVKGVRWGLFLHAAGVPGMGSAVRATFAGAALNNLVVANGGDAARVAALARWGATSSAYVLATLVVDRACDLVTYIVLFVVAALVLPVPAELSRWRAPAAATLVVALAVIATLAWRANTTPAQTRNAPLRAPASKIRDYWRRLVSTTRAVATPTRIALTLALSFVAWAGQWATFHFSARSAELQVTATTSLLALLVVNASFAVRITPGNVGVFQLLYALAATASGVNRDDAIAVAFLISAIQYIPVTLIGLLLAPTLFRRGAMTSERMRMRGDSKLGA